MKKKTLGGLVSIALAGAIVLGGALPAQAAYHYTNSVATYEQCRGLAQITMVLINGRGDVAHGWGCNKGSNGRWTAVIHYTDL